MTETPNIMAAALASAEHRAAKYHAKVASACYALGQLETTLQHPEWPSREEQLAQAVADLRVALLGTTAERDALEARRAAHTAELLGRGESGD